MCGGAIDRERNRAADGAYRFLALGNAVPRRGRPGRPTTTPMLRAAPQPGLQSVHQDCHFQPVTTLESLRQRKAEIEHLAARYGAHGVRIFGSVARDAAVPWGAVAGLRNMLAHQ